VFRVPSFRPCGGIPLYSCSVFRAPCPVIPTLRRNPFVPCPCSILFGTRLQRDPSTRLRLAQDDGETRYHSLRMTVFRHSDLTEESLCSVPRVPCPVSRHSDLAEESLCSVPVFHPFRNTATKGSFDSSATRSG
jgi:hypothetical protein